MDAAILNIYRVIWSDLLMIYDTATFYFERRVENRSLSEFGEGLNLLIQNELTLPLPSIEEDVALSESNYIF